MTGRSAPHPPHVWTQGDAASRHCVGSGLEHCEFRWLGRSELWVRSGRKQGDLVGLASNLVAMACSLFFAMKTKYGELWTDHDMFFVDIEVFKISKVWM